MLNYNCVLCPNPENEWCYTNLCSKCTELKKIVDLYGINQINETLTNIYVRDIEPIKNRENAVITRSKTKKPKHEPLPQLD